MGNVSLEPLTTQTSQSHKPKRLRSTGEIKHLRIVLQYMYSVTFHHCLLCTFHIRNFNLWHLTLHLVSVNVFRSVVGTFLCGPAALATVLEKKCAKYSDVDPRKTKFYFNKENFWAKKNNREAAFWLLEDESWWEFLSPWIILKTMNEDKAARQHMTLAGCVLTHCNFISTPQGRTFFLHNFSKPMNHHNLIIHYDTWLL